MPRLILPTVALALALSTPADATEKVTEHDHFELWNNCLPTRLLVEDLHKGAAAIGLTKEDITVAARSRLRAARLYSADRKKTVGSFLLAQVSVVGAAFSSELLYFKRVVDLATIVEFPTVTWSVGSTGTHGENSEHVLSSVSRHMDRFIDEYLRVNAAACRKSK